MSPVGPRFAPRYPRFPPDPPFATVAARISPAAVGPPYTGEVDGGQGSPPPPIDFITGERIPKDSPGSPSLPPGFHCATTNRPKMSPNASAQHHDSKLVHPAGCNGLRFLHSPARRGGRKMLPSGASGAMQAMASDQLLSEPNPTYKTMTVSFQASKPRTRALLLHSLFLLPDSSFHNGLIPVHDCPAPSHIPVRPRTPGPCCAL